MVYRGASSSGGGYSCVNLKREGKAIRSNRYLSTTRQPSRRRVLMYCMIHQTAKARIKRWMSSITYRAWGLGVIFGGVGVVLLISFGA
jgi:hypothetical protein